MSGGISLRNCPPAVISPETTLPGLQPLVSDPPHAVSSVAEVATDSLSVSTHRANERVSAPTLRGRHVSGDSQQKSST
jgi:hypothetical protein